MTTSKERMLNAYKGKFSEYYPVAPEFWYFYPAKVLGVTMPEFEREIPHWKGLLETFKKYDTDGWGISGADVMNQHVEIKSIYKKVAENTYRDSQKVVCNGLKFERSFLFHDRNPSWVESFAVKDEKEIRAYMDAFLSEDIAYDFTKANEAHKRLEKHSYLNSTWG